jgi:hypothetical protein
MLSRLVIRIWILAAFSLGLASAQNFPFNLLVTEGSISATVPNNSQVPISADVGTQAQADVRATYVGTSQATIAQTPNCPPCILGSTEFSATIDGMLPLVLNRGDSFTFHVKYSPTSATAASAQLNIPFTEPGTTANATPTPNAIVLLFQGTSPSFTLSYVLQSDNNTVQISPGGTIQFNPTQINIAAQAFLDITNTGSGPGQITAISLTSGGPIFKLQGIPLFPPGGFNLNGNQALRLTVLYTPTAVENDTGSILITYQNGKTAIVNLAGSGATSTYTYTVLTAGASKNVPPPGPIVLPPATVGTGTTTGTTGTSSSVIVKVTNSGNANGTVNSVSISGPFALSGVPINPPTLKPGDTFSFSITYTPTQVGTQTGQLVVGSDVFTLSGQGLGPQIAFSYVSSAGTITIGPNSPAVVFSPVTISQTQTVNFIVTNSGTSQAIISNIVTSAPFSVTGRPALPLTLASGQSTQFSLSFTPVTVGPANGTLQIDSTTVPLTGSGTAPPTLPSYTFTGPTGNVSPLTQAAVSLTLANSYPLNLGGTLTITTSGNFGTDQSVQFETGGRAVNFIIPANSTSADFAGQGSQVRLQTGTVAETVTLTPSFATSAGVDVTPFPAPSLQFTVASAAPALVSLQVTGQTANSLILLIIGYSTPRNLSSLSVTFNPASGFKLGTTQFTMDLSQVGTFWFASTASQAFGGQFEISVPFTLTGKVPTGTTLLQTIASVSVTVSNSVGTSNSLQANAQ